MADFYPPGTDDGKILHRAAHELLPEFVDMINDDTYAEGTGRACQRFDEAIRWLLTPPDVAPVRLELPLEPPPVPPLQDPDNVQGGILTAYPDTNHGGLLFLQFSTPAALAAFLGALRVTSEADRPTLGQIVSNVAFSVEGLRVAGLSDDEVRTLPDEFCRYAPRGSPGLLANGPLEVHRRRRWRLPASD